MIHWPDWTIVGTLCGFRGNPNPGSTERAVCVAEVIPAFEWGDGAVSTIWAVGDGYFGAPSVDDAQRAAEAAVGDGQVRELEEAALSIPGVAGVRWYLGAREVGVELHVTDNGSHDSPAVIAAMEKMRAAMPEVPLRLVGVLCPL